MFGKINKDLYMDNGGEVEYYIHKNSQNEFLSHAFQYSEGMWKHYEKEVTVTDEMLSMAKESYGEEDAEFLAAMDELQQCPPEPENITEEEKEKIINNL